MGKHQVGLALQQHVAAHHAQVAGPVLHVGRHVVELVAASQPSLTVESAPSLQVSSIPPAASALAGDDELPEDLFGKKPFLAPKDLNGAKAIAYAPAYTIMGGTSSVMRNILGERVLGLPREPKVG